MSCDRCRELEQLLDVLLAWAHGDRYEWADVVAARERALELRGRRVELADVAALYVFRAGRQVAHLVDVDDPARTACGLELVDVQLVLAGAHRACRWCELAGDGRAEVIAA